MSTFSPFCQAFKTNFEVTSSGSCVCKITGCTIEELFYHTYCQMGIIDDELPSLGLPVSNQIVQIDQDNYHWFIQWFEAGVLLYDPDYRKGSRRPGFGQCYPGDILRYLSYNPLYKPQLPNILLNDISIADKMLRNATSAINNLKTDIGIIKMYQ